MIRVASRKSIVESQKKRSRRAPTFDLRPSTFDLLRLHGDERGSISFATVFALLLLTMLLGMVINTGRQIDSKVKLQNSADASTYSGGVVVARGMNSLAFSNHMLCEVLALTAFFREGRDRHVEPLIPEILAAWDRIGPVLEESGFEKFERLGRAIPGKTPLEQEMVRSYSEWMAASSEIVLPVFEAILNEEMIPEFQRDVVLATPLLAQTAAADVADRHTGNPSPRDLPRGRVIGVFWRTMVDPVGGTSEDVRSTLPAVDPQFDAAYAGRARTERDNYARHYLRLWNNVMMRPFDTEAKMSQFGSLWRSFTCGQLEQLLEEHATRNLPHMLRTFDGSGGTNRGLELDYMFVGVAYRAKVVPAAPKLFTDSLAADNQAYAQGMLFVPRPRIVATWIDQRGLLRAIPQHVPTHWDLWNQNWSFQLVPATAASVGPILSTQPQTPFAAGAQNLQLPNLGSADPMDLRRVTTH